MPAQEDRPSLQEVRRLLARKPGRLLLLVGQDTDGLAATLADAWAEQVVSVGERFAAAAGGVEPKSLLETGSVFVDLDVLFWAPAFHLQVIPFLRDVARQRPTAFVWPGTIVGNMARYSETGRKDHYEADLEDAIVLRAKPTLFGGEPTFEMEMVGA